MLLLYTVTCIAVPKAHASTKVKVGSMTSWIPAINDCRINHAHGIFEGIIKSVKYSYLNTSVTSVINILLLLTSGLSS